MKHPKVRQCFGEIFACLKLIFQRKFRGKLDWFSLKNKALKERKLGYCHHHTIPMLLFLQGFGVFFDLLRLSIFEHWFNVVSVFVYRFPFGVVVRIRHRFYCKNRVLILIFFFRDRKPKERKNQGER